MYWPVSQFATQWACFRPMSGADPGDLTPLFEKIPIQIAPSKWLDPPPPPLISMDLPLHVNTLFTQPTYHNDEGGQYRPNDTPAIGTGLQQCEIHWYAG